MRSKTRHKKGFTLIEAITALALFVTAVTLALSGFLFLLKNSDQENTQTELDVDVLLTMERLKQDIRLSSLDEVYYYADVEGKFEALSFPLGEDADGNGILDKDVDGTILWGSQIIYHIRPTTPNELVRTVFYPRDASLTQAQRQEQLEDVVADGDGSSTFNSGNAASTVLFENLLNWEILPTAGLYDGYSDSTYPIREEASLGYALISPGSHTFTFEVADKNSLSSGYNIGIDQLFISPSYGAREAERQNITASSGATAAAVYMSTGSWKGRHHLLFPASNTNQSFTLEMDNDRWEESNFSSGSQVSDAEIAWNPTLSEYVVQLDGMKRTWEASEQTGSVGADPTNLSSSATVYIQIRGADEVNNGGWITTNGKQCKLRFQSASTNSLVIKNVYITDLASGISKPVKFSNSSFATASANTILASDWVDLEINKNNNYLVELSVGSGNSLRQWSDVYTSGASYGIETNGTAEAVSYLLGLKAIFSSYPTNGVYTSRIFDTHLDSPQYSYLTKTSDEPVGTSIAIEVRTGNDRDLADAPAWSGSGSRNNSFAISSSSKRYVQFQATLKADSEGRTTPKLRDVTIEWAGEERLVNIGGVFTKGNDYGIFKISVDGQPLRSSLIVELEIYKENILGINGETRTISSSLKVDITPRNSGL